MSAVYRKTSGYFKSVSPTNKYLCTSWQLVQVARKRLPNSAPIDSFAVFFYSHTYILCRYSCFCWRIFFHNEHPFQLFFLYFPGFFPARKSLSTVNWRKIFCAAMKVAQKIHYKKHDIALLPSSLHFSIFLLYCIFVCVPVERVELQQFYPSN